jgi:C4-type Zn-finger protein
MTLTCPVCDHERLYLLDEALPARPTPVLESLAECQHCGAVVRLAYQLVGTTVLATPEEPTV